MKLLLLATKAARHEEKHLLTFSLCLCDFVVRNFDCGYSGLGMNHWN
jgi:hypothetical protein